MTTTGAVSPRTRSTQQRQQPLSSSFQPAPSLPPRRDVAHPDSIADATGFDLQSLSNALSAATAASAASGAQQDPILLAYLEEQFSRLHSYMNLLDEQLGADGEEQQRQMEQEQQQQADQAKERQFATLEERLDDLAQRNQEQQEQQQHHHLSHSSSHLAHPLVERVDQSPTPHPATGSFDQASSTYDGQQQHGVVSRSESPQEEEEHSPSRRQLDEFDPSPQPALFPREEDLSAASPTPTVAPLDQPSQAAPAVAAVYAVQAQHDQRVQVEDELEVEEDIQEDLAADVSERMGELFGLDREDQQP